jgi:molecular chaperone GrpE
MTEHAPNRTSGQPPAGDAADTQPAPDEGAAAGRAAQSATAAAGTSEDRPMDRPMGRPGSGLDAAELEDRWRRALADLDNQRKRYARELGRERTAERKLVAAAFLPVLDTIDRALEHAKSDPQSIVEGVRTLREQALAVLAGLGYRREDEVGVPFDPARHEVVGVVDAGDSETPPGSVASVVRPGYGTPGAQLRPAAVTVAQNLGN